MQIGDLVNQYQANLSSGPDMTGKTKAKGTERLTKTLSNLQKGQIFEGTVNSIKGNQVILGLSSGQNITARLDRGIALSLGESIFFQVKSNEDSLIQIKPVSIGALNNPTLLDALSAAGLPVTEDNVNMVNTMMKEQMPIDAKSISDMAKKAASMPGADVSNIVTMTKHELPITKEMVSQFENYKANEGQLLKELSALGDAITETLVSDAVSEEESAAFAKELGEILTMEEPKPDTQASALGEARPVSIKSAEGLVSDKSVVTQADSLRAIVDKLMGERPAEGSSGTPLFEETVSENKPMPQTVTTGEAASAEESMRNISRTLEGGDAEGILSATEGGPSIYVSEYDGYELPLDTAGRALSPEVNERLSRALDEHSDFKEKHPEFFDEGGAIRPEVSAKELFTAISDHFSKNPAGFKHIAAERGFSDLIDNLFEQKLSVAPEEIKEPHRLDDLYREIDRTMERVARASEHMTRQTHNPIAQAASEVHDNIDFISHVNQMYSYIQIPLKLSGQQATGDLYVYKNKKQARDDDDTVSAFLHFDLEHLGSTDISVKMKNKKVDTKFYMEDDRSYDLIMNNIHILKDKLDNLGYTCDIVVENDSHPVDFVSDFLERGAKVPENIQRYSFDVRA